MAATARKSESVSGEGCCCSRRRASHAGPAASKQPHDHAAGHKGHTHGEHTPPKIEGGVRDPVCGMLVDPHTAKHRHQHDGRTYYFCSGGCLAKFVAEPAKYLSPSPQQTSSVPEGAIYTCPMHPQIRQVGPGSCPICGMALEPVLATAEAGPNAELIDMSRRFWIGLVLSLPVVALEMGGHLTGLLHYLSQSTSNWIQMILATPVVLWGGWPFFVRGWQSLLTRNLNMFTLIAMGTGVAWVYSVVATLAPGDISRSFSHQRRCHRRLLRSRCGDHSPCSPGAGP